MPADSYTVSSWTPAGHKSEREYTTSSGSKCLVRDLELEDVVELGLIDDLDSLTSLVKTEHIDRVNGKKPQDRKPKQLTKAQQEEAEQESFKELMKDKSQFAKIATTMDKVVATCVLQPKLLDPWVNDPNIATAENPDGRRKLEQNERDPEAAYLDYVTLVEKIGIFHEVFGGMERLQQFREASDQSMGAVADEPKSANATGGSSGN